MARVTGAASCPAPRRRLAAAAVAMDVALAAVAAPAATTIGPDPRYPPRRQAGRAGRSRQGLLAGSRLAAAAAIAAAGQPALPGRAGEVKRQWVVVAAGTGPAVWGE